MLAKFHIALSKQILFIDTLNSLWYPICLDLNEITTPRIDCPFKINIIFGWKQLSSINDFYTLIKINRSLNVLLNVKFC